jgi:hypothetical protein
LAISLIEYSRSGFALAYRSTVKVKHFFGSSIDLKFRLDENLSNYKEYGYGDVTYFTVT